MKKEFLTLLREKYTDGKRVELIKMDDPQAPPKGTLGTVRGVDDAGNILVDWDNGCGLNVVYGEDIICMPVCEEMKKLRKWLDDNNIEWIDYSDYSFMDQEVLFISGEINRTRFTVGNNKWSVIHGFGTYGGYTNYYKDEGLLELRIGEDEPIGHLTAEQIIEKIKRGDLR